MAQALKHPQSDSGRQFDSNGYENDQTRQAGHRKIMYMCS